MFLVNIPVSVITGLLANWIGEKLKKKHSNQANLVISIENEGKTLHYDHDGREISDERFLQLVKLLQIKQYTYSQSLRTPKQQTRRYPIFLEHSNEIVGWASKLVTNEIGLRVEDVEIINNDVLEQIQNGTLRGFSVGGLVKEAICSVCGEDYVDCNHIANENYDGVECGVYIKSFYVADISIVKNPANLGALIEIKR